MPKKIKVNIYDDMRRSLADALAYERGQAVDLRVTKIPAPPAALKPAEIRRIRESLHASRRYSRTSSASAQKPYRAGNRARDVHKARHCVS